MCYEKIKATHKGFPVPTLRVQRPGCLASPRWAGCSAPVRQVSWSCGLARGRWPDRSPHGRGLCRAWEPSEDEAGPAWNSQGTQPGAGAAVEPCAQAGAVDQTQEGKPWGRGRGRGRGAGCPAGEALAGPGGLGKEACLGPRVGQWGKARD